MDKEFLAELAETSVPCRGMTREFFADPNDEDELFDDTSIAVDACYSCPLMIRCGEQAIKHHKLIPDGVMGGYTAAERKKIVRSRRAKV